MDTEFCIACDCELDVELTNCAPDAEGGFWCPACTVEERLQSISPSGYTNQEEFLIKIRDWDWIMNIAVQHVKTLRVDAKKNKALGGDTNDD